MKIENWNGNQIRFVEIGNEWWAVLKDVCDALGLRTDAVSKRLLKDPIKSGDLVKNNRIETNGGTQEMLIVNEYGIYDTIFRSNKSEAKEFRHWVYGMLKTLREADGLEGFQIFRQLDKEHQKAEMKKLNDGLKNPVRVDFIKANTIANKAISTKYGYPKMIKKGEMTPKMMADREPVLEETVKLMNVNDEFGLGVHVANAVYKRFCN